MHDGWEEDKGAPTERLLHDHICAQKTFQLPPRSGFQVPDSLGFPSPSQPLSNKTISQAFYFSWLLVSALKGLKQAVSTFTVSRALLAAVQVKKSWYTGTCYPTQR